MKADHKEVKRLLNTVRGQIDGIINMVNDDRYCIDISHQLLSSIAILKKTNEVVLKAHLQSCVKDTLTEEGGKKIDEIFSIIGRISN